METSRALAAALTLAITLCGAAAARASLADRVDELVRAEMERQKIPGVAVAVVTGTGVPVLEGYGLANVEHSVPVTADTIFQSGSVGKQFTSALVMTLVEEGKLGLDDSIRTYLPSTPASWQPITLRHLLSHTSGIPDYTTTEFDYRRDYTEDDVVAMASKLELEFPPGTRWNYSNTGYALLGVIAGKAGGKFYGDLLQDRVFEPLGMQTARVITEEDIVPHRAAGYRLEGGVLKNQEWVAPTLNTTADGSLYLSILDLVRWDSGLRSGAVLKKESWAKVYEPIRLASGKTYPYGFGWSIETVGSHSRIHHGGSWQGFQSYVSRFPDDGLTILALANLAQADLDPIVDGIAKLVDATLVAPPPTPITATDPSARARLEEVLRAAASGGLRREDFAYVRAGFFPAAADRYRELLSSAGELRDAVQLSRKELGDDVVYTYDVRYPTRTFGVQLGLAPDGKVSGFAVWPKEGEGGE